MQQFNSLTIYRSSAGSGKTYTLVKEYLKLALAHPNSFSQILAITFTNKASEEMKSRIVSTLVDFTEGKSAELKEEIRILLKMDELAFNRNIDHLLGNILHKYSDFAVCTIDSFFHKIISALAKEMQLPLKFDTELNEDAVIYEIISRLLMDAGKNKQLTVWLEDFIISKMNDDKGWSIERELHLIAKELFKEDFRSIHQPEETITSDFIKQLRSIKYSFEAAMKAFGLNFLQLIRENNLEVADFAYGKSGVAGYLEKLSRKISCKEYEAGKRVQEANENPAKWVSKTSLKKDIVLSFVESDLRFVLEDALKYCTLHFEEYNTANEVLNLIYIGGIVNKLDEKLKAYRDENDLLLISDTNLLLKNFISDSDTPFIYEKTGNRYRHFMIDEFQDTSGFQWDNMLPLIENSLAAGSSVMMVGDAKQSIYRWRGGKMQLLLNGIQNDLRHYATITKVENLKTNFRSKKEVVDFNNSFFSLLPSFLSFPEISDKDKTNLIKAYHLDEVNQQTSPKNNHSGYVEISFYENGKTGNGDDEGLPDDKALNYLLKTLQKIKAQGYEEKDVCIIVRRNIEGNQIARFLFDNGYKKIVSSESLLISKAPQIIFLIHLMKLLNNDLDKIARAEALYFYLTYLNVSENKSAGEIFSSVNNTDFFKQLPDDFSHHLSMLRKLPLYELTEQLIDIFKLNAQPDAYIQRFQDLVLEYLDKNPPSLSSFLEWWDEKDDSDKCSVIVPSDENAIHIISIHKSKGLQFPIVIMPYPGWELKPKSDNILWMQSDVEPYSGHSLPVKTTQALEKSFFKDAYRHEVQQTMIDNLNLLYVAFTRAEEALYIFCPDEQSEKITRTTHLISNVVEANESWKEKISIEEGVRKLCLGALSEKPLKPASLSAQPGDSFENPEIITLKNYNSNPWQNKIVLAINKNKISVKDESINLKSDFGILIHQILSKIIYAADAEQVLADAVQQKLITDEQLPEFKKIIDDVLAVCSPYNWFSNQWKIKTEAEMILPDGSIIRPDRVMIRDKELVLLDYKSGEEDPAHEKQLAYYAKTLIASGYKTVESWLLYIKGMKLVKEG